MVTVGSIVTWSQWYSVIKVTVKFSVNIVTVVAREVSSVKYSHNGSQREA